MGFVGKIAKATEISAIKYKSLYFSDLYLIFHRFSILFVDLITVHEVLPHDVGCGGDGGDGVEERLGHPDGEDGILLPEGLAPGGGVAEPLSQRPPDLELDETDDQGGEREPQLDRPRNVVEVDDERRGPPYGDGERCQPQVKRNLTVAAEPPGDAGCQQPAELRDDERHDEERSDARENLGERTDTCPGESENRGGRQSHGHVAEQAVCRHGDDVGAEHAGDDNGGHGDGGEDANHGPLRDGGVERQQGEIDCRRSCCLEKQQPHVKPRKPHFARLHAAERDEEHQKDKRRGNHPARPFLHRRDGTAQQGADDHSRGHGDAFQIAADAFGQVHPKRAAP